MTRLVKPKTYKIKPNNYEVTKFIKQANILNGKKKILPLYNVRDRLIPFPVELLTGYTIRPIDKERKIGKIVFQIDMKIVQYPFLKTLLGESCLFYYYRDNIELHNILTEIDIYLYASEYSFDYISDQSFSFLTRLKRDLAISIQEGKSPESVKLIRVH